MAWYGLRDREKQEIILKIINEHPEGLNILEICEFAKASFSPVKTIVTQLFYMKKIRLKRSKSDWIKFYYPKKIKQAEVFKQ